VLSGTSNGNDEQSKLQMGISTTRYCVEIEGAEPSTDPLQNGYYGGKVVLRQSSGSNKKTDKITLDGNTGGATFGGNVAVGGLLTIPGCINTSDEVELDGNIPVGAMIFAPNCYKVKSLLASAKVYSSLNNSGEYEDATTSKGHTFNNQGSRIFVRISRTVWKEFDCQ
jgi:hypothetical protein